MLQRVMSQIAAVKKDMIILEKSEFSTLLAENEVRVFINPNIFVALHLRAFLVLHSYDSSFSVFSHFSQKLKIQLLQLKVQLGVRA